MTEWERENTCDTICSNYILNFVSYKCVRIFWPILYFGDLQVCTLGQLIAGHHWSVSRSAMYLWFAGQWRQYGLFLASTGFDRHCWCPVGLTSEIHLSTARLNRPKVGQLDPWATVQVTPHHTSRVMWSDLCSGSRVELTDFRSI